MLINNVHILGKEKNPSRIFINKFEITAIDGNVDMQQNRGDHVALNFKDAIAFPGLINSHDHLEFNMFPRLGNTAYNDYVEWGADIHARNKSQIDAIKNIPYELRYKWGLYKNLICGVTAIAHHGNGPVYKYESLPKVITNYNYLHSIQLEKHWKAKLNLSFNSNPYVVHLGEGRNGKSKSEIIEMLRWNLFGKKIIGVHGIALNEKLSEKLKALVWCPDSNLFLYDKTADIASLKQHTNILFGTDSTLSADWNIWKHLRLARKLNALNDKELFTCLTAEAAKVWNDTSIGTISVGKTANVVVCKRKHKNEWESFYATNPEDILIVLMCGKVALIDKEIDDAQHIIDNREYDLISIGSSTKYVTKGIEELVQSLRKYFAVDELPVSMPRR